MRFGVFSIPFTIDYAEGRSSAKDVIDWDLQIVQWADQYDIDEAFFAEHYTLGHEPSPAPDLMIAAASQITKNIKLGAGAHLLPYHNPVALAHRMLWLDHMTGGRYIAGVAPGAYPSDAQLFGTGKNNPKMMAEALDIIEAIWTKPGPFTINGEFWSVDMPAYDDKLHGPHLKSYQQPHPPMIMTGMQEKSPTLTEAGKRGFLAMSQQVSSYTWAKHWETYSSAATQFGHTPKRADWRVCRDIFVADTDAEARDLVLNGGMGRLWREHNLPNFIGMGLGSLITGPVETPVDLDVEWLVDNFLIVGSPETVEQKIRVLYQEAGGFGTLITTNHEYADRPEAQRRHLELLGTVVKPMLADLEPTS